MYEDIWEDMTDQLSQYQVSIVHFSAIMSGLESAETPGQPGLAPYYNIAPQKRVQWR
jgi:hypothetical protein